MIGRWCTFSRSFRNWRQISKFRTFHENIYEKGSNTLCILTIFFVFWKGLILFLSKTDQNPKFGMRWYTRPALPSITRPFTNFPTRCHLTVKHIFLSFLCEMIKCMPQEREGETYTTLEFVAWSGNFTFQFWDGCRWSWVRISISRGNM